MAFIDQLLVFQFLNMGSSKHSSQFSRIWTCGLELPGTALVVAPARGREMQRGTRIWANYFLRRVDTQEQVRALVTGPAAVITSPGPGLLINNAGVRETDC